ncbi:unnamed protein product [Choristocarpus tenellus]
MVPVYDDHVMEVWESVKKETRILENVSLGYAILLAALYPFIRNVDDVFCIRRELVVVMFSLLSLAVTSRLLKMYKKGTVAHDVEMNLNSIVPNIVFLVSVVEPMWRLAFDPLSSKRLYAEKMREKAMVQSRSHQGPNSHRPPLPPGVQYHIRDERYSNDPSITSQSDSREAMEFEDDVIIGVGYPATSAPDNEIWTYERLASSPTLAPAFEDYARKALCQESVQFLTHVSRYEDGNFTNESDQGMWFQFETFSFIVRTYICSGSPEEVNISFEDKKRILQILDRGICDFARLSSQQRRDVFVEAYKEVCDMLEANLLQRFMTTEEFLIARARSERQQLAYNSSHIGRVV